MREKGKKAAAMLEMECAQAAAHAELGRQRVLGALLLAALLWHRPWRTPPAVPGEAPMPYRVDVARDPEGVLTLLGGVGPKLAARIAEWRQDRTSRSLDELLEV